MRVRLRGEVRELLLRVLRGRILDEHRRPVGHRVGGLPPRGDASAELPVQGELLVALREAQRHAEHADHVLGAIGRLVALAQQIQRAAAHVGRRVLERHDALEQRQVGRLVGLGLEERADLGEGRGGVTEIVEIASRDALPHGERVGLGGLLGAAAPEMDELLPALLPLEETLEARDQLPVAGAQGEELREVVDGAIGGAGEVLRELRSLVEELLAARVVSGSGEAAVVDGQQLGPALADREDHGDALQRPVRLGIDLEHARQHAHQVGGVLREPLLVEAHRALPQRLRQVTAQILRQHGAIERADLVRSLRLLGELLQPIPARVVLRIRLGRSERLRQLIARLRVQRAPLAGKVLCHVVSASCFADHGSPDPRSPHPGAPPRARTGENTSPTGWGSTPL